MVDRIPSATVWPIALVLAGLLAEAAVLRLGIDDLDEGYFVQQAARVLQGQLPYRDFESFYTPGLVYVHAAIFALLGGPSLVAVRIVSLVARAVLALLLFDIARPHVRRAAWAAVPSLVLLLGLDDAPVRWEPHPGWLSTLFAVVAAWCIAHPPSRRWLIAGAAAAAVAYAFKQNTGVFMLAAILVWCGRRQFWPPLAAFVSLTALWFVPLAIATDDLSRLGGLVGAVNQTGLFAAPEPTLVIPLAALVGGLWLVRRDSDPRLRWYLLAGSALVLTEFPRMDTLHLAWAAPLLLVLGAMALDRLRLAVSAVAMLCTVALLAPTWTGRLALLAEPRTSIADVEGPTQTVLDLQATLDDIQQRTGPDEPIFVYPTSPLLYVLAERPNPTRFDHLNPGATDARQLADVIADVQQRNVRLIVISDFWEMAWGSPGDNAVLEAWLETHFTEVGRHGAYRVLVADL